MRILLVNANGADGSAGGAERYTADLGNGLRARGHDVRLLAAAPSRDDRLNVKTTVLHASDWRDSITRRVANRIDDLRAQPSSRLLEVLASAKPDLVHTNTLPGITTGVWEACRRLAIPVVHTLHDHYLLCARTSLTRRDGSPCSPSPLLCGLRSRRLLRHGGAVSQVIGVSNFILAEHFGMFPEAQGTLVRLPVGLDVESPVSPPLSPPKTLGYLGRLESEKGVRLLVDAAEELSNQGFALRIAGDGTLRPEVERAARAGLLEYAGVVHDQAKTDFIAQCDIGVLPSIWLEPGGPPYAPLEWLASLRPVLVSDRGGLPEAAEVFTAVEVFDPTAHGLVGAVLLLRDKARFDRAVESLVQLDPKATHEHWLDEHERIYAAAA